MQGPFAFPIDLGNYCGIYWRVIKHPLICFCISYLCNFMYFVVDCYKELHFIMQLLTLELHCEDYYW